MNFKIDANYSYIEKQISDIAKGTAVLYKMIENLSELNVNAT